MPSIDLRSAVSIQLADGWHNVDDGSLEIDEFAFEAAGGTSAGTAMCFRFTSSDATGHVEQLWGPVSSIVAVSTQLHTRTARR